MLDKIKEFQITIFAIILALGLVAASKTIANNFTRDGITVTGSAFENVKSDNSALRIDINSQDATKAGAYNKIKDQTPKVKNYLLEKGFTEDEIQVLTTNSYPTFKYDPKTGYSTNIVSYYNFSQPIKVTSKDVNKIKEVSLDIQNLLDSSLDINVSEPEYYYSGLADLKVRLLENATKDAKSRASAMLKATHNRVGKIQSVKMGVFQITPKDSNNVSDMGINDTSTIDKKVTAVANVVFKIK